MSSYARYRAAAADVEAFSGTRLKWKLRQAEAELRASLPFLGDDIFVLIAAELDARMLGRLACTAPRFWRASGRDPVHMTVWLNGEMVQSGIKLSNGKPVAPLVGPLRWAVGLNEASVRIDGPKPPLG